MAVTLFTFHVAPLGGLLLAFFFVGGKLLMINRYSCCRAVVETFARGRDFFEGLGWKGSAGRGVTWLAEGEAFCSAAHLWARGQRLW
jgi:hypothetical protein